MIGTKIGIVVPKRTHLAAPAALVVAALALSGCVGKLFTSPPPVTYDLTGIEQAPKARQMIRAQILVPEPSAIKILNSERMVVSKGAVVAYYPNAQYPDTLPHLIQTRVVEAFEKSGTAKAVGKPGEGLSIDYQLLIDIRKFEFDVGTGGRTAEIELAVRLMNDHNGKVVATQTFDASTPVAEDSAASAISGFNAGLDQVLGQIISWSGGKL